MGFLSGLKRVGMGILRTLGQAPQIMSDIASSGASGALAGSALGPEGSIAGLIGGGTVGALKNLHQIIGNFSGMSQSVPMKMPDVASITGGLNSVASSVGKLHSALPQGAKNQVADVLNNAPYGKTAVQLGQFSKGVSSGILNSVFKGQVRPDHLERLYSGVRNMTQQTLSDPKKQELAVDRSHAHVANLIRQPQPVPAPM